MATAMPIQKDGPSAEETPKLLRNYFKKVAASREMADKTVTFYTHQYPFGYQRDFSFTEQLSGSF